MVQFGRAPRGGLLLVALGGKAVKWTGVRGRGPLAGGPLSQRSRLRARSVVASADSGTGGMTPPSARQGHCLWRSQPGVIGTLVSDTASATRGTMGVISGADQIGDLGGETLGSPPAAITEWSPLRIRTIHARSAGRPLDVGEPKSRRCRGDVGDTSGHGTPTRRNGRAVLSPREAHGWRNQARRRFGRRFRDVTKQRWRTDERRGRRGPTRRCRSCRYPARC